MVLGVGDFGRVMRVKPSHMGLVLFKKMTQEKAPSTLLRTQQKDVHL